MADYKTLLGLLAVAMTIWAHIPYLIQTVQRTITPHIFSWIIWTLLTFIAFAVQLVGQAGPGAWVTFVTGVMSLIITVAAFKGGEKDITRFDWVMFIAGLAAIPLWVWTNSPFWSIILVTAIDCSAFAPTFRKAWHRPYGENSFAYGFNIPRHTVALFSIAHLSVLTALYPAALLVMNAAMYAMLKFRRNHRHNG